MYLQAKYLYETFVQEESNTLNTDQFNPENKNQLQQYPEKLTLIKEEIKNSDDSIIIILCDELIDVCSDLQTVRYQNAI